MTEKEKKDIEELAVELCMGKPTPNDITLARPIAEMLYNKGYRKLPQNHIHANTVYSDSTMKSWTKDELIEHIRVLEYNWNNSLERIDNQVENCKQYTELENKRIAKEILQQVYDFLNDKNEGFDVFELAKEYDVDLDE